MTSTAATHDAFLDDVRAHREARTRRLSSSDGWLSLVARVILDEGDDNALDVGTASLHEGVVTIRLAPGIVGTVNGKEVAVHTWPAGAGPGPFLVVDGRRYELLRQSTKVAVRVRDPASAALKKFAGLDFFAADPKFRVQAQLLRADPPRMITTAVGLGVDVDEVCPGTLVFVIDGEELRLDPVIEDDARDRLFLNFKDPTNGKTSYGAGRFLYAPLPDVDGKVTLDFNKAYNPPCALTEFASCPVAPAQNRLSVPILAGEKYPLL